jgi:Protein of unknown function (DUF3703)
MIRRISHSSTRQLIDVEMTAYRLARDEGDSVVAWRALERAHIISQPFLTLHIATHMVMLKFAIDERDIREIIGQLIRLALAPLGALTGRIPIGNTGRSNVSAFEPMPVPEDLKAAMKDAPR